MQTNPFDVVWLDTRETITAIDLSRVCGLSLVELDELVDYGALAPLDAAVRERQFGADCVMPLRTAGRLRRDYDLDVFTLAILLDHLRQIETLERQVRALQARVPAQPLPAQRGAGR